MKQGEEYSLQQACVKWFRLQYPHYLCFSCPNEATYRNKQYFANLGALAGVSDLICVLPNKILFIELKSKTGRQSVEQKQFMERVEDLGFEYHLIRDIDSFIELINEKI